ncbi:MAG: hypothetical protein U0670_20670 [Anaerolineae bacterium]
MRKRVVRTKIHAFRRGRNAESGQALVEYALLLALLIVGFGVVLAATGPAIGNVFGNVVYNVIGQDLSLGTPLSTYGAPAQFWATVTWVAQHPQQEVTYVNPYTPPAIASPTAISAAERTQQALQNTATAAARTAAAVLTNAANTATGQAIQTQNAADTLTATNMPPSTLVDTSFSLPFVEQANNNNRWRLDTATPLVDNVTAVGDPCTWAMASRSADSASRTGIFDNSTADAWAASRTCYLELRGSVDISGATNPRLSFWQMYDFTGASGVTATLQVANYMPNGTGGLDRVNVVWHDVPLISTPSSNYNWTRIAYNLNAISGFTPSTQVTFRFKLQSTGAAATLLRWYIDDIQVYNDPSPTATFGLNKTWDLNTRNQMDDFIFDADSARTLESIGQSPGATWRWDLTSNHSFSGFSFDDSPFGTYPIPTEGSSQQHQIQIRRAIDLTTAAATDSDGDTGNLALSFMYAYDVPVGTRLEVQYTTDVTSLSPTTWTTLVDGLLLDFGPPSGAPLTNEQTARTNLSMQRAEFSLEPLKAAPFRLRMLMTVNSTYGGSPTVAGEGWYIDEIRIERSAGFRYENYPFTDDAQDSTFASIHWIGTGTWGIANESGINGFNNTTQSYADSPNTNYPTSATSTFGIVRVIDLLNETPGKLPADAGTSHPAATTPTLTFWHLRDISSNVVFYVDAWTANNPVWTSVWSYDGSSNSPNTNISGGWERVEIDLREAAARANEGGPPVNWTWGGSGSYSITGNSVQTDDDIRIRFRIAAGASATAAKGVYIDNIRIGDQSLSSWKLWSTASGGTGDTLDDYIESASASLASSADQRWWLGAMKLQSVPSSCSTVNALYDYRLGSSGYMLADSVTSSCLPADLGTQSTGRYSSNDLRIAEMQTIIDLTSTPGSSYPTLYYWTRRFLGTGDSIQVQVATENTSDTTVQSYNDMAYWSAWTTVTNSTHSAEERDTWQREALNLTPYIGSRIRLRWVLQSNGDTSIADGFYIDGVRITYSAQAYPIPLTTATTALSANWVREGKWGAGMDYFFATGIDTVFGGGYWTQQIYGTMDLSGPTIYPVLTNIPGINLFMGTNGPFVGSPVDAFSIRWTRTSVTLNPGTYTFSALSDDGMRLYTNTTSGTDITGSCISVSGQYCIFEEWFDHSTRLSTKTVTVTTATPRNLTLEFYENAGSANIALSITADSFSFTDSPNTMGAPVVVVNSIPYGDSSLTLNGYVNTQGTAGTQSLYYRRLYQIPANTYLYTEYSTDGGFTWTIGNTKTGAAEFLTTTGSDYTVEASPDTWEQIAVALPDANRVIVRFRYAQFGAGTTVQDGVYITDVYIQ